VTGLILRIDRPHRTFVVSCSAIPGYMEAMVMPIPVREEKMLDGLERSKVVDFTLVVDEDDSYAENIRIHNYESLETEPLEVRRLQLLNNVEKTDLTASPLVLGQPVEDFTLIDQTGQSVTFSQFRGKVIALAFIYTSCPLPNYCFRLTNNFGRLQKRFADRMGRDLVLLSITFDPVHDRPDVLTKYAATWTADPNSWHFLTGSLPEVKTLCHKFGVNFWPDEGTLTHSLHTVVIDRAGRLAANFEGNEFTSEQLGDFVESSLRQANWRHKAVFTVLSQTVEARFEHRPSTKGGYTQRSGFFRVSRRRPRSPTSPP
jgi:protein SCO1